MILSTWMKEIPDFVNISKLNIPGAHNASTKFCSFSLFSKCQNLNITELLNNGVRMLDLRVDGDSLVHSFAKCKKSFIGPKLTIKDIFKEITDFLNLNPTETVLIIFKNDGKTSGEACLNALKETVISKAPNKWYLENKFPPLGDVRGKIILINRINSSIGIDFSKMPYQGNSKEYFAESFNCNENQSVTVQDRYTLPSKKKWEKSIKPLLDNEDKYGNSLVFNHLSTAGFPLIPRINASYINKKLSKYSLKSNGNYGILSGDFMNPQLCEKIIKTNF